MAKEGFDEVTGEMARKDDLVGLRSDVVSFQKWTMRRFDAVDYDLKVIKKQLDRIVYRPEFEKLETRVKDSEDLFVAVSKRR